MSDSTVGQTKQFGKGQRTVPHPVQKAQKWYPVDDEPQPKKVSTPCEEKRKRICSFVMGQCDKCAGQGARLFHLVRTRAGVDGTLSSIMELQIRGEENYI